MATFVASVLFVSCSDVPNREKIKFPCASAGKEVVVGNVHMVSAT